MLVPWRACRAGAGRGVRGLVMELIVATALCHVVAEVDGDPRGFDAWIDEYAEAELNG